MSPIHATFRSRLSRRSIADPAVELFRLFVELGARIFRDERSLLPEYCVEFLFPFLRHLCVRS